MLLTCTLTIPCLQSMPVSDNLLLTCLLWPCIQLFICPACTCLGPAEASSTVGHQSSCNQPTAISILLPAVDKSRVCCSCKYSMTDVAVLIFSCWSILVSISSLIPTCYVMLVSSYYLCITLLLLWFQILCKKKYFFPSEEAVKFPRNMWRSLVMFTEDPLYLLFSSWKSSSASVNTYI